MRVGTFAILLVCIVCVQATEYSTVDNALEHLEGLLRRNRVDGDACMVCQFGLAIIEENIGQNVDFWEEFLLRLCELLPTIVERQACQLAVKTFGVEIIIHLLETYNPDYICGPNLLNVCQECTIDFVDPKMKREKTALEIRSRLVANLLKTSLIDTKNDVPPEMLPAVDADGDNFSPVNNQKRTAKWRGRDCDDTSADIHAGFMDVADGSVDNNCNGIVGVNANTGKTYEEEYCQGSKALSSRRSIVMFGDSAAAAFRIPVEWLNLQNLTTIPETAIQELDFPHMSWSTGYEKIGNDSIYLYMREKNLCNHIDFQNLAKNGAVMEDLAGYQVESMTPSDYPLLAFIAYIGNDVCGDTLEDMTTTEDFYNQAVAGLDMLNAVAAPGSKVVLSGLVDGRILWDTLYANIHPLGMTYEDFYNFLTCTNANPCVTWLNSNEAIRNATSFRAMELSEQLQNLANNETLTSTWENLDIQYLPFPVEPILNYLVSQGEDPALLIEPVDGFHPSQYSHRLIAKVLWELLSYVDPSFFGELNPNNPLIAKKFPNPPPY